MNLNSNAVTGGLNRFFGPITVSVRFLFKFDTIDIRHVLTFRLGKSFGMHPGQPDPVRMDGSTTLVMGCFLPSFQRYPFPLSS